MQQISFLSSQGQLPRDLFNSIDDFFDNVSVPKESKILKNVLNLFERLLNIHSFKNVPSQQVQHSTYSSLLQQQSAAPKSSHSLDDDDDDYLSRTGNHLQHATYSSLLQQQSVTPRSSPIFNDDNNNYISQAGNQGSFKNVPKFNVVPLQPDNLHAISSSFIENSSIFPENPENLKVKNDIPKTLISSVKHQLLKIPFLELKTPHMKDTPQQTKYMPTNDILSLIDSFKVLLDDSLGESIQPIDKLHLSGKNSQTEVGKLTEFPSFLDRIPSDQTKTFVFLDNGLSQPGILSSVSNLKKADKDLLSSKNILSASNNKIVQLKNSNKEPFPNKSISLNTLLLKKIKSPGNITSTDNNHSAAPKDHHFTSHNFPPFKSVPNYQNKSLNTLTGFNKHNKKPKVPKNKTALNGKNKVNAGQKVKAHVSDTKKEKQPDCLKRSTWISKCYECNCSDDGFPVCKIVQDCVLPPRGKYLNFCYFFTILAIC